MAKKKDRDGVHTRSDRSGFFISYTDAAGNRRKKKVHAPNLTEARKMRSGFIARVEKMKVLGVTDAEDTDFDQVTIRYLKYQKPRVSDRTYERYEGIITQHLRPAFRGKVGAVTRSSISDYITDRLNEASPYTVQKEFNVIKHLLRLATDEWNLIPQNPAETVTPKTLGLKAPTGRVRFLHPDELLTLLGKCPLWLRPIVVLAIATGLRRGNLVNLRWPQCHRRIRQIIIDKTKNGERVIVHLNQIGELGISMAEAHFGQGEIGRVFPGVTLDQTTTAFRRACKKANIENFRFHDLRHTNASWLRMTGTDIHTIAVMLCQKDIRMAERYSHLLPDFLSTNAKQLDGVFSSLLGLDPAPDLTVDLANRPRNVPAGDIVEDEIR